MSPADKVALAVIAGLLLISAVCVVLSAEHADDIFKFGEALKDDYDEAAHERRQREDEWRANELRRMAAIDAAVARHPATRGARPTTQHTPAQALAEYEPEVADLEQIAGLYL